MLQSLRQYLMAKYFDGKYNFTAGSLHCPKCGTRFADVDAGMFPIANPHARVSPCPNCRTTIGYAYEFEADFSHGHEKYSFISAIISLFSKENKYIFNSYVMHLFRIPHFLSNHFDMDLEGEKRKIFIRKCNCGKEIRLIQRRVF